MLDGLLGFQPTGDGFRLAPRLPSDWPSMTVKRIAWHGLTLRVTARRDDLTVEKTGDADVPAWIAPPPGNWRAVYAGASTGAPARRASDGAVRVDWAGVDKVRFERIR
jgi:hypothetical protein